MEKIDADKKKEITENLEFDLAMQRATEEINRTWEARTRKLKQLHDHEFRNLVEAQKTFSKPKLIDRILGRYRDLYIIYNGKVPVFCHQKGCEFKNRGVNFGIETICLSREQAMEEVKNYTETWKEYSGMSFHSVKIIHVQVDRRGSRQGMVVRDITIDHWDEERKNDLTKQLNEVTADKMVLDSLMSMRPKRSR